MMNFEEWFWTNIWSSIGYIILALIIAIIFVAVLSTIFDVRLKDPKLKFYMKSPIVRLPSMKNPMRKN